MTKRRGRPLSFNRTNALEAAMQTFWQFGYGGTSIADLTAAMGISAQSLYSAFGSKSELYHEALELYQEKFCRPIQSALSEESSCLTAIERMLTETARLYCGPAHPRGCMISTANLGCAAENCDEVEYVSQLRKKATKRIQKCIEQGIRKKELPSSTDAVALATYISVVMQGMSVQAQDGTSEQELLKIIQWVTGVLRSNFPRP